MATYLIIAFSVVGCGALFPSPARRPASGIGYRYFGGFAALTLILFIGNVVLGVRLGIVAAVAVIVAAIGLFRLGLEIRRNNFAADVLLHPIPVFLAMGAVLIAVRGDTEYLTWQWDEYSRWAYLPKLIFLNEQYRLDSFRIDYRGYTPGWPLLIAFPSLVTGRFAEGNPATLPFLMHIGVLGIFFDLIHRAFQRNGVLVPVADRSAAWVVVLLLLAVEATWMLVPTLLAHEKPQIYTVAASLGAALFAMTDGRDRMTHAGYLGLFLAFGYLIKVSILAFVPSAMLLTVALVGLGRTTKPWFGAVSKENFTTVCLIFVPILVCFAIWSTLVSTDSCLGTPDNLLTTQNLGLFVSDAAGDLAGRLFGSVYTYVSQYKMSLGVVGGVGLIAGLFFRSTAMVSASVILFSALSLFAIYAFHLTCFGDYYFEALNSVPRFTRIWLRLVHTFGLLNLVLIAVELIRRRGFQRARAFLATKFVTVGLPFLAVSLLAWQGVQANRSFHIMATRSDSLSTDGGRRLAMVLGVRREAKSLKGLIKRNGLGEPNVLLIVQGSDGIEQKIANYAALADARGGSNYHYRVNHQTSFSERPANVFTMRTSAETLVEILRKFRIVWPFALDPWITGVLRRIIADDDCRRHPERYFLVRGETPDTPYSCVPK